MKVVIVNAVDAHGGAARSAWRLHRSLRAAGVESLMLVNVKTRDDPRVQTAAGKLFKMFNTLRPALDKLPLHFYRKRSPTHFSPALLPFSGLAQRINRLQPDIVHLHWVCDAMLFIPELSRIEAPVVWTLHDNWAFTGGCHVKWECERYRQACGRCPRLGSEREADLSRWVFHNKRRAWARKKDLTLIGPSRWMSECAQGSALFRERRVVTIPNGLDTALYAPVSRAHARQLLNLPPDRPIILFGAIAATSDFNKGFDLLLVSLRQLKSADAELLVFGSDHSAAVQSLGRPVHFAGHVHDDISLRLLYAAADVLVVPSRQENLSNVMMEGLACGTPVVAFDIGGNKDLIDHRANGYLAAPLDAADLALGIDWVLQHPEREDLQRRARAKVLAEFDSAQVLRQHLDLYSAVMSSKVG